MHLLQNKTNFSDLPGENLVKKWMAVNLALRTIPIQINTSIFKF